MAGLPCDGVKLRQALIDGLEEISCLPFTDLSAEVLVGRM